MDDGEVELSDHVLLQNSESSSSVQASVSVDSFLNELLKTAQTCTHTHTCNPPGPDAAHTHTCYHTHTHVFPSEKDYTLREEKNSPLKPKRPSGNREAVRKYREKKKAHSAYLEEEVKKLRFVNQQLIRKLQGQAVLETEVMRLRGLLVDLRGKIDNELGAFPFQKQRNSASTFKEGNCTVQSYRNAMSSRCETDLSSFHPQGCSTDCGKMVVSWAGNCEPPIIDCQAKVCDVGNAERCSLDSSENLLPSASQA